MIPIPSQILQVTLNSGILQITLDTGATVSYIRLDKVLSLSLTVHPNNQLALLADQKTRMASLGEVDYIVTLGNIQMRLRALVMKNLQAPCFGGTTFHADNNIQAIVKTGKIIIHGKYPVEQFHPMQVLPLFPPPSEQIVPSVTSSAICTATPVHLEEYNSVADAVPKPSPPSLNEVQHEVKHELSNPNFNAISLPTASVTFPSDFLSIPLSPSLLNINYISISPSFPSAYDSDQWSPQICEVIDGHAMFKNFSTDPLIATKYSHFKPHQVSSHNLVDVVPEVSVSRRRPLVSITKLSAGKICPELIPAKTSELISMISINLSIMSKEQQRKLDMINKKNHHVFDTNLTEGYNHAAGQFYADFTFSNKPPPTRVFVPQYNKKCSALQQAKCDELEAMGVLVDPKVHGIPVLHVSPSWIQQKGRAKHKNLQDCSMDELRFITAFNTLNDSIRAKNTTSCSSNTIFLFLAKWKFHIFADLNNSYFQLPVQKNLWSYLGIMTPHKGIRVMTRTGQGLLGSDVELEELLSRVLGEDTTAGHCVALRDDIIIGGNSIDEALKNYESVISKLHYNNLKLSPNKVRVFPADTEVYGYRVKDGCILPSDHTITSLGKTKIEQMTTVKQVNSWKGLYKTLIGHLPALSNIMSPFDSATGGKNSSEKFSWTPALTSSFNEAMNHLTKVNQTYLPEPSEQLILLPDAMSTMPCVGWVLYVVREEKMFPITYCTAKLKDYMIKWYP